MSRALAMCACALSCSSGPNPRDGSSNGDAVVPQDEARETSVPDDAATDELDAALDAPLGLDASSDDGAFPTDARGDGAVADARGDGAVAADARADVASPDAGPPVTRIGAVEQGTGRVMVFDARVAFWSSASAVRWTWSPADSPQIAATHRAWFGLPSEVKWRDAGRTVLVTASRGGVAVIRVSDRAATFYANAGGNPHSIERLPDGNIATASSDGGYVRVFSTLTRPPATVNYSSAALPGAHGVVWDAVHTRLWAVGNTQIVAYAYGGTRAAPTLRQLGTWPLPSLYGHELNPIPNTHRLFVTTNAHAYEFDTDRPGFSALTHGPDRGGIKSLDLNPQTGQVLMVWPTESWWTDTVRLFEPTGTRQRTGARFYKARWWAPG